MSNTKQILAMLESRADGGDGQFYAIALQIAASEVRSGHRTTAEQLSRKRVKVFPVVLASLSFCDTPRGSGRSDRTAGHTI